MITVAYKDSIERLHDLLESVAHRPTRWPALLTRAEAAEYCSLSVSGFDQWVREGRLPPPIPRSKRWSRAAIDLAISKMDGSPCISEALDEASLLDKWLSENHV